jgi:transposase
MPSEERIAMGHTNRRIYSKEFVDQAVALATAAGASVTATARTLGVPQKTLDCWVKRERRGPPGGGAGTGADHPAALRARVQELERRLARAEAERELLKKATAYFAGLCP